MEIKEFRRWERMFKDELQTIIDNQSDSENAHSLEDGMRERLIDLLVRGELTKGQAELLARVCQETSEIDFDRWCA